MIILFYLGQKLRILQWQNMSSENFESISYVDALLKAQRKILLEDSDSLMLGINVSSPSAIFGSVKGLSKEFGNLRIIETPASENAVTGIALGLATSGHFSILIHQRLDFAILSFDMLINQVAKWKFMYGDQLYAPLLIRMIVGRGWGQGPQHSQSLHSFFMHVPGFNVFAPSTSQDVYASVLEASKSRVPTILIEHRWLYELTGEVNYDQEKLLNPIRIHASSQQSKVTFVCFSFATFEVLRAKNLLETIGINVDVLEMVKLNQQDLTLILESLEKTRLLIIADIGHTFAGAGAAILAEVIKQGAKLKKPPYIFGLPNYPTPTSPSLTSQYYPRCIDFLNAVSELIDLKTTFSDPDRGSDLDVPGNRFIGYY